MMSIKDGVIETLKHEIKTQTGLLGAMMAPMAHSFIAPVDSSLIEPSSLMIKYLRKRVRSARRGYNYIITFYFYSIL